MSSTSNSLNNINPEASPSAFPILRGREEECLRLRRLAQDEAWHALLISGPRGSGKQSLAEYLAKSLLCLDPKEGEACGVCPSCRYFSAGTHPDYRALQDEQGLIRVDRLRREVLSDLSALPQISHRKIYFIAAGCLNEQGQNVLLKSLEEPPEGVRFLLTAEREDQLLPTLLSRVIRLGLPPLSDADIRQILLDRGYGEELDHFVAFAMGIPGKALELAEREDFPELRQLAFRTLSSAAESSLTALAEGELSELLQHKEDFEMILRLCQSFLRDLALMSLCPEQEEGLQNPDYAEAEKKLAGLLRGRKIESKAFQEAENTLIQLQRGLEVNVNMELAAWHFLLAFHDLFA